MALLYHPEYPRRAAQSGWDRPAVGVSAMWRSVLNFILFYVGWFACVVGMTPLGARWWGPAAALVIVSAHLAVQPERLRELRAIGLALAIGPLCDIPLMAL